MGAGQTSTYINPPVAPPLVGGYGYGYGYGVWGWSPFSFFAPGPSVAVGVGGGFDVLVLFGAVASIEVSNQSSMLGGQAVDRFAAAQLGGRGGVEKSFTIF
ncbi:hypothetical protein ABZP36_021509 [Zizania latifolia]